MGGQTTNNSLVCCERTDGSRTGGSGAQWRRGELWRALPASLRTGGGIAYGVLADRHLAEDAAQETFVIASRQLAGLRNAERFAPWVCTIARRVAARWPARGENERHWTTAQPRRRQATGASSDLVRQAVLDLPERSREVSSCTISPVCRIKNCRESRLSPSGHGGGPAPGGCLPTPDRQRHGGDRAMSDSTNRTKLDDLLRGAADLARRPTLPHGKRSTPRRSMQFSRFHDPIETEVQDDSYCPLQQSVALLLFVAVGAWWMFFSPGTQAPGRR